MKRAFALAATVLALTACRDSVEPATSAGPLFSPASTFSWAPIAPAPTGRYAGMAATGPDGRIFVFGGVSFSTNDVDEAVYDPTTNSWASIAQTGVRVLGFAEVGKDGRIYIGGGQTSFAFTNDVLAYDIAADTYTPVASMSSEHYAAPSAAGADGRIYVVGGDGNAGLTNDGEVYDPATNTWTGIAPAGGPHYGGTGALGADGRIYVFTGYDASFVPSTLAEAYNPATNTWTPIAPVPAAIIGPTAVAGGDGHIYVFGGSDNVTGFTNAAYAYEPATDTWTTVASMNVNRYLPLGAAGLDGRVFAIGGFDGVDEDLASGESLQTATPDTQAPTVSLSVSPSSLWPPNHRMVRVAVGISARDDRDASPTLVVTVTSSEPDNGTGDGDTAGDTQVVDNGNNTFDVWVRAERSGKGSGRVYTITATATDAAGNVGTQSGTVTVFKSRGK